MSGRPPRPSARRRLRLARRILGWTAGAAFLVALGSTLLSALRGASPLVPAGALYAGTVAYGLGEMLKLRERVVFGPAADGSAPPWVRWWLPRVLLVLLVAALPALLFLGGL